MPSKRVKEKDVVVSAAVPARHKPATTKRDKRTAPVAAAAAEAPATKAPAIQPVPVAAATRPVPVAPSQEKIASLAYSYWVARGYQGGSPEADWLRAEQELLAAAIA
jgi:hypothetical protein